MLFRSASLSAVDDQQREGAYYLYDNETLAASLNPQELAVTRKIWNLPDAPAFEFGHLLSNQAPVEWVASELKLEIDETIALVISAMQKLKTLRAARNLPVDEKRLAGWNALALKAFVEGARQSGEPRYAAAAEEIKAYLAGTLWQGGRLYRARADGRALGTVSLADYAYVADALLAYGDWRSSEADIALAHEIVAAAWRDFHHANGWRRETESLLKGADLEEMLRDETLEAPDAALISLSLRLADERGDAALAAQARGALRQIGRAHV